MIEIRNVSHRYDGSGGGHWALRDVSLTVDDGTFVSFLGTSGGPAADRAMVFQEFNLLPWRTARGNVEMPLEVLGYDARRRAEISARVLEQVGLAKFAQFYPHQLSGGMKQRVGLARALAVDPTTLFMDEPFGALDPQIREMMQIELMKLWEAAHVPAKWEPVRRQEHAPQNVRKTVLFVTHSVDEAVFLSDRIVMFGGQPGRVIADIAIDLARPRWRDEEALKRSTEFLDYRHHIWQMLKQQLGVMPEAAMASGA